jgi:hypothetical protein
VKKNLRASELYGQLDNIEDNKRLPLLKNAVTQIKIPWDITPKKTGRKPADIKHYQNLIAFILWHEAFPTAEKSERSFIAGLKNDENVLRHFGLNFAPSRTAIWRIKKALTKEYREQLYQKLREAGINEYFRKKRAYRKKDYQARKAKVVSQTSAGNKQA